MSNALIKITINSRENVQMYEQVKIYQKRCMKTTEEDIGRSILSVSLYAIEKTTKFYCSARRRRAEYYAAGVCGNQNKKRSRRCNKEIIENLLRGKNVTDSRLKIPIMCW